MGRTTRRMPRPTMAFMVVFLGALLVVFGASALPTLSHDSPPGIPQQNGALKGDAPPSAEPELEGPIEGTVAPQNRPDEQTISTIGQTIAATLFAATLLLLVVLVLSLRRKDRADVDPETAPADLIAREAALRAEVAQSLTHAGASLDGATAGQIHSRLIASWVELEQLAASAGQERRGSQTPTEHAGAMLAAFGVSRAPLARLLALYERARYDAGTPGWEPDLAQGRRAGADFTVLAEEVAAAGKRRPSRPASVDA
ncbi:MAG: DUF4129 domain-containing protein [Micrococcaceae bacterium]|uniref:DUF4129 domain-containing protein n=1 Tax=unclassified Arthrobacter TaxID=235627 RepID=UPI0026522F30|nr:DUF4129 domain-containing protein [Micrococcaceae bacterium]MDN5813067.1 DUF4129 domain-containing protein [Micrococcaceae bacterium]MDN5904581.1 DUF4129 domain-containing protein [Micrococcaceae bacterium]MDN6168961.1 DUF4129 domain-containing protein [Micrococcaceae bacterium]MDN6177716.1 DUF4129 domain-containing protein [Micrococcaceae bacterium]